MKASIKTFLVFSSILTIGAMLFLAGCSGSKSTTVVQGASPVIQSLSVQGLPAVQSGTITATVVAQSIQNLALSYTWTAYNGWSIVKGGSSPTATIKAPDTYGAGGTVTVRVSDTYGRYALVPIPVSTVGNSAPVISSIIASPNPVIPGGIMTATVIANDPDGDGLTYTWTVPSGWTLASGQGTGGITITAPTSYASGGGVTVTVSDGNGGIVSESVYVSTSQLAPQITNLIVSPNPLNPTTGGTNTTAAATVTATDPDGNSLTYTWSITSTTSGWGITGYGVTATITAPLVAYATATVKVIADNGKGWASFSTINVFNGFVGGTYPVGTSPYGIAIDSSGNVWVANYLSNNITELNSSGTTIGTYTVGAFPETIAIDASGNVWVTNGGSNNVTKLNSSGTTIGTYPVGAGPWGIAIDSSGNVWVANNGSNNVTELNSSGTTIGTYGAGSGPWCIAIASSGNIWVTNNDNTVTEITSSGITIGTYGVGSSPAGIAIDSSGNVWVANACGNDPHCLSPIGTVTKLNSSGTTIGTYAVGRTPWGIAIDSSGNVWVTNAGSNNVTELNSSGTTIGTYTAGFNTPIGIAIDSSGNVWVANSGNSGSGNVIEIMGIATGPQYFPYAGPQWP